MDLYGHLEEQFPDYISYDYYSYDGGDDYFAATVCPDNSINNNNGEGILWLTVDCWQLALDPDISSFTLFVKGSNININSNSDNLSNQWRYKRLDSIADYDIPFQLLGSTR